MKAWWTVMMVAIAVGCAADTPEQSPATPVKPDLLSILQADMSVAKLTVSNRQFTVVVQWLTQIEAQTCQRPLDLYLADSRIGAFIRPIQNQNMTESTLHALARAFRLHVVEYLKNKKIPEKRVLAAKDIGSIYMKDDAEPTNAPYSSPAPRVQKR